MDVLSAEDFFNRFYTLFLELKVVSTQGDLVPYIFYSCAVIAPAVHAISSQTIDYSKFQVS